MVFETISFFYGQYLQDELVSASTDDDFSRPHVGKENREIAHMCIAFGTSCNSNALTHNNRHLRENGTRTLTFGA
jgi:hypothetical protein